MQSHDILCDDIVLYSKNVEHLSLFQYLFIYLLICYSQLLQLDLRAISMFTISIPKIPAFKPVILLQHLHDKYKKIFLINKQH